MRHDFNIVVFDLETGGLSADKNPVVEIAICPISKQLEDLPEYTSLIKPYGDLVIQQQALEANGLTMKEINGGQTVEKVCNEVIKVLKSLKVGKNLPILCGHNIRKFDNPFLKNMFEFCGEDLFKYVDSEQFLDTLEMTRMVWDERPNYKLGTCTSHINQDLVQAHRALPDTRANKELIKHLLKGMRGELGGTTEVKPKRFRDNFKF